LSLFTPKKEEKTVLKKKFEKKNHSLNSNNFFGKMSQIFYDKKLGKKKTPGGDFP